MKFNKFDGSGVAEVDIFYDFLVALDTLDIVTIQTVKLHETNIEFSLANDYRYYLTRRKKNDQ